MTRQTTRRIKKAAEITTVCVPVALTYELLDTGSVSIIGIAIGVALAVPLVALEESGFDRRLKRLSVLQVAGGEGAHVRRGARGHLHVDEPRRQLVGGPDDP